MLEILYRHLSVAVLVALLAGTSWVYGGARPAALLDWLPWIFALACEVFLLFPQRRPYEDMPRARRRLWHFLAHDPLTYVAAAFLLLLAVPLWNHGLCPNCDADLIAAGVHPEPPATLLPFCVDVPDHISVLTWFVPSFVLMLAVRHTLGREGRRVFFEALVWNSVLLAVFGFIEHATAAEWVFWETRKNAPAFFSVFGYPNQAGAFFTLSFACAIGLWRHRAHEVELVYEETRRRHRVGPSTLWLKAHYPLAAALVILFAVVYTRCRAAILLTSVLSLMACFYAILDAMAPGVERYRRVKTIAITAFGMLVVGITMAIFAPKGIMQEMQTANLTSIADRVTGKCEHHVDFAWAMFTDYTFFGTGGWGYKHLVHQYYPKEKALRAKFRLSGPGAANVHNDYMQFLCEHGLVGGLLLLAVVVLLFWPIVSIWNTLYRSIRFVPGKKAPASPRAVFVIPPAVFWTCAGAVCIFIHAFGDCPLRGTSVMALLLSALAAASGFLPHPEEIESTAESGSDTSEKK